MADAVPFTFSVTMRSLRRALTLGVSMLSLAVADVRADSINANHARIPYKAKGGNTAASDYERWGHNKNIVDDGGATCDASADATAAFTTSANLGLYALPSLGLNPLDNYCKTTFTRDGNPSRVFNVFGSGRWKSADGHLRGPIHVSNSTRPTLLSNYSDNYIGVWDADWSRVPLAIEVVNKAGAFGAGPGTYEYEKQQSAIYLNCYSAAGRNSAPDRGNNRSGHGCLWIDVRADVTGEDAGGDHVAIYLGGGVSGTHTGSTVFLANPEVGGIGGAFHLLQDGTWAEPIGDLDVVDHGFDGASFSVININRGQARGDKGANHMGWLVHSFGAKAIDAAYKAAGRMMTAFDATAMNTDAFALAFKPTVASAGTGYAANQVVQPVMDGQWQCDQIPTFRIGQVDGSGVPYEPDAAHPLLKLDRRGICQTVPSASATISFQYAPTNTVLPLLGSGLTAKFVFSKASAITLPFDGGISFASYCDGSVFAGCFPPTEYVGKYWLGYDSTLGAVNLLSYLTTGPVSLIQFSGSSTTIPAGTKFIINGGTFSPPRNVTTGSQTNMDAGGANTDNVVILRTNTATQFTFSLIDCTTFTNGRKVTFKEASNSAATSLRINTVNGSTVEGGATYTQASKTGATYQCDYVPGSPDTKDWVKIN